MKPLIAWLYVVTVGAFIGWIGDVRPFTDEAMVLAFFTLVIATGIAAAAYAESKQ